MSKVHVIEFDKINGVELPHYNQKENVSETILSTENVIALYTYDESSKHDGDICFILDNGKTIKTVDGKKISELLPDEGCRKKMKGDNFSFKLRKHNTDSWENINKGTFSTFTGEIIVQNVGKVNLYSLDGKTPEKCYGILDPTGIGAYKMETVMPYHCFYKEDGVLKKHIKSFDMKGTNMCNLTSVAMALIYCGWGAYTNNNQKENKDLKMLKDIPRLPDRLAYTLLRNMYKGNCDETPYVTAKASEELISKLELKSLADNDNNPHESVEIFKKISDEYIRESDSGLTGTVVSYKSFPQNKAGFKNLLKTCFEYNSGVIKPLSVPVIHVCGYYSSSGDFTVGGHYVCCSGLAIDDNGDIKQLKIDDPWPNSPKGGNNTTKNGVNGNNVWHTVDEFYNNFINNSSNTISRNTIVFIKCCDDAKREMSEEIMDDDTDEMNSGWDFSKVDSFVQQWTCELSGGSRTKKPQTLLEIDRYYDFYTGMTPYAEVYFRTSLKKDKNNVYQPVFRGINSLEHPFIKNINIKDNGVKTVTVELYDKDFASYTKFSLRNNSFSTSEEAIRTEDIYSLDELIKCSLRNDFNVNNNGWAGATEVESEEPVDVTFEGKKYTFKKQEEINKIFNPASDYNKYNTVVDLFKEEKKKLPKVYKKADGTYYKDNVAEETNKDDGSGEDKTVQITEEYLKFANGEKKVSPTNLRVRIGYADQNQKIKNGDIERDNERIKRYYGSKGCNVDGSDSRTHRWWDATLGVGEKWSVKPKSWVYSDGNKLKKGTSTSSTTTQTESANSTTSSPAGSVSVSCSWDGVVSKVFFNDGDTVEKGKIILTIKVKKPKQINLGTNSYFGAGPSAFSSEFEEIDENITATTGGVISLKTSADVNIKSGQILAVISPKKEESVAKSLGTGAYGSETVAPILASDAEVYNDNVDGGTNVSVEESMDSIDQTTKFSRAIDLMITNYSSTLTPTGINYTITGIETKEASLMSIRFLQRYAEIVSYPEEVLYLLMHMFNENNGEVIQGSSVKLLLLKDNDDLEAASTEEERMNFEKVASTLVQEYDPQLLTEEEAKKLKYTDTYNALLNNVEILPKALKKISISFGSEKSLTNYNDTSTIPPMYKSVYSLLNEFCAACPPKKLIKDETATFDPVTNEKIEVDKSNQTARPLKWFSVKDAGGIIYCVFYYRREIKPRKIRLYRWGPQLPYNTCIKQISIQNSSEFALLSGVRSFNANKGKVISRVNVENCSGTKTSKESGSLTKSDKKASVASGTAPTEDILNGSEYNLITSDDVTANSYDVALSSSMYEGSIELLGDPFYLFNGIMQPCTYPIRLEVLMPMNEYELKNRSATSEMHYKFGGVVLDGSVSNQRFHEMTGYYVVKEIEHNISSSGFTTKLSVMSYPNIEKSVLDNPDEPISILGTAK